MDRARGSPSSMRKESLSQGARIMPTSRAPALSHSGRFDTRHRHNPEVGILDGAATAVGVGPQLGDRPDEPRCPVADDEKRAAQTAAAQAAPEVEPVLGSLPLSEADVEQDW